MADSEWPILCTQYSVLRMKIKYGSIGRNMSHFPGGGERESRLISRDMSILLFPGAAVSVRVDPRRLSFSFFV